jgi:hypothetical protein
VKRGANFGQMGRPKLTGRGMNDVSLILRNAKCV